VFALIRRAAPFVRVLFVGFLVLSTTLAPAGAQSTTVLSGTVTANGAPVAGATITAVGGNLTLHATSDAKGRFVFVGIPVSAYDLDIASSAGNAKLHVDATSIGTDLTVSVAETKTIGRTVLVSHPSVRGSGTDLNLTSEFLARSPAGGSLPALLIQLPGAARGANGVVHINGDHGDINYIVDGVEIPQELNRSIGTEFDPRDIASVEVLQGAYPAQYGEKFATVLNINTRNGGGPPGFDAEISGGSFASYDGDVSYHAPIGTGNVIAAVRAEQGNRGLDPPNVDSPHDAYSSVNQFLRYTQPMGNDFLNLTVSHTYGTYQIPPDVDGGAPAATDDSETQDDTFAALQYRHPVGDHGLLSFGPSYKRSTIVDYGDPANDFIYGEAQNPGLPTDCALALSGYGPIVDGLVTDPVPNPAVNYTNASCAISLFASRTAIDVGFNLDYENRSPHHDVRVGGLFDATHVDKTYDIAEQPGNFLAPIYTPATPGNAYTVVDDSPNIGHLAAEYLQDSWTMGRYLFDYGVRANTFLVSSDQFAVGYGQLSPRLKLTRFFGTRDSVYVFYGRFFTPFSLENVSPIAAYTLNLPLQASVAQFDLKPQRDSVYEFGGHLGLGRGDLGMRVMQKDATDLIDDTEVGTTNLHQDINYALGRIATQTLYYQLPLDRGGRFYASATHTYSVTKGCETQLLAPCFGQSEDWTPADHDQRIDVTSGVEINDHHGGWFGLDGEYGSGLSSQLNPTGGITCAGPDYTTNIGGPCKRTPHTTFDAEKGWSIGSDVQLTARIENLFDDEYLVTYLNAQGNHYASPRTFELGLRFGSREK
jgi:outer membrane receptor protein involved in Fe transport